MTAVASRRKSPWINGKVKVAAHALDRAWERMAEKFQGATRVRVAKMLERAVRHPQGEVIPIDSVNDGKLQVAVPVTNQGTDEVIGYLSVGSDTFRAGVVAMTWLEPWMVDSIVERLRRMRFEIGVPRWWDAFSRNPDEPGFGVDKSEQSG